MKYYDELTVIDITNNFKSLKLIKENLCKQIYKSALRGNEYILLSVLRMDTFLNGISEEEIINIISEFSLGKVECEKVRNESVYYVLTDPDIWKRVREIDQYIKDNKLRFFRSGYLEIEEKTKYDKDILDSKSFVVNKDNKTFTISLNKTERLLIECDKIFKPI